MSQPRQSLNAYVDGYRLLQELDFPLREQALPSHSTCPVCDEGSMRHYQDHAAGGQWCHCASCGHAGDMIELAAKVWGLSPDVAVARLRALSHELPDDPQILEDYVEKHLGLRRRLAALWTESQAATERPSEGYGRLASTLRLRCQVLAPRWAAGPGRLFGFSDKSDVERCFAPKSMAQAEARNRRSNPSEHAVFKGKNWHELLMIPYYDLPERISGFYMVGRDGDLTKDVVFKATSHGFHGNQHAVATIEAGLAMHPQVLEAADQWQRTVIAYDNPLAVVRLQLRRFDRALLPLPLVAWHDPRMPAANGRAAVRARTRNAWEMLGNRKLVFWMPKFKLKTIGQAIERDALISTVGPEVFSAGSLRKYLWYCDPQMLWHHIHKSAVPWPRALAQYIREISEAQLAELYYGFENAGFDAQAIFARCGRAAGQRVALVQVEAGQRTARLGAATIIERAGSWYAKRGKRGPEELISNALVRIDKLCTHPRLGTTHAAGRVLYGDREIAFSEELTVIERGGMSWLRQLLVRQRAGILRCDSAWSKRLVDLAGLFHQPRIVAAATLGWDADQLAFVLPGCVIQLHGAAEPLEDRLLFDWPTGRSWGLPVTLSGEELDRVADDSYVNRLFWAVVAALAANLFAPQCWKQPLGIALQGAGAQSVGHAIAEAVGCLPFPVAGLADVRHTIQREGRWPLNVTHSRKLGRPARAALWAGADGQPRNLVTSAGWHEARALAASGGWMALVGDAPAQLTDAQLELAELLLPAYVLDACQRRMEVGWDAGPKDTWAESVLADLAKFVIARGGNPAPVHGAGQCILRGGSAQALGELLGRFVDEGRLQITDSITGPGPHLVREGKDLYLSEEALAELLKPVGGPVPTHGQVVKALACANALRAEREGGVVFSSSWLRKWRRQPGTIQKTPAAA